MDDPRLRFIVEDGRNYLTHTRSEYDLIAIEVGQVFRPGLASFYTLDFYEAARRRLKSGGILCQFVPLAAFQPEEFRTVLLLAEVEGLPLEEVARVMVCPVGTVKSRIFRAKERLRALLRDYETK